MYSNNVIPLLAAKMSILLWITTEKNIKLEMCSVSTNGEQSRPAQQGLADRLSFFLQHLISIPLY